MRGVFTDVQSWKQENLPIAVAGVYRFVCKLPGFFALDRREKLPVIHRLHYADVAHAVDLMLDVPGIGGRTFNAADDAPLTVREAPGLQDSPRLWISPEHLGVDDMR